MDFSIPNCRLKLSSLAHIMERVYNWNLYMQVHFIHDDQWVIPMESGAPDLINVCSNITVKDYADAFSYPRCVGRPVPAGCPAQAAECLCGKTDGAGSVRR